MERLNPTKDGLGYNTNVRKSSVVTLGGKEYKVDRVTLRVWLQLEEIRSDIKEATDRKDREGLVANIYSYLSVAISSNTVSKSLPWFEVVNAFAELNSLNSISIDLPLFRTPSDNKEKIGWDYKGRSWYAWAHVLAEAYGWSLEYIAELDIDDALALIEEISVKDQLDKEWEWALSEKSVQYDKQGKGKFKELHRPSWMSSVIIREPKMMKIKKSMLPAGIVVKWQDETPDA